VCSKGTYIRAFARDLGVALQSGAHLTRLRRTRSGKFNIQTIISLENFEKFLLDN
jgi:tRNA pseudouridine55 synthase